MIRYILIPALVLFASCSKSDDTQSALPIDVESIPEHITKKYNFKFDSIDQGGGTGASHNRFFTYAFDNKELAQRFIYEYKVEFLHRVKKLNITQTNGSEGDEGTKMTSNFGYGFKRTEKDEGGGFIRLRLLDNTGPKYRVDLIFWEILD